MERDNITERKDYFNPLDEAMAALGVSARTLGRESGVDHTLLSRWQQGKRVLRAENKQLPRLAEAMLRLDSAGTLHGLLAAYRMPGETALETLCAFLTDTKEAARHTQLKGPLKRQTTGSYVVTYQVHLGKRGFRRAALAMLDEARTLPTGQTITVLAQGRYEWIVGNLPFVMQFLMKLRPLLAQGTRLMVINRRGYSVAETAAFAGPWLLAHLKGYIRSRYYDGDLPPSLRFAASIPGYWSARAIEDVEVEDNLFVSLHTDSMEIKREEALVQAYMEKSTHASQYGFFASPLGNADNPRLWQPGSMPRWEGGAVPDGTFHTIVRVPGFGLMTRAEYDTIRGQDTPAVPDYLFAEKGIAAGRHRIILCREDIREGLQKARRMHEPLTTLLGRRVFISREMLAAQLQRLLEAMASREDFEVALVPRVAFTKLQMEMVCWKDGASVCWLQDMKESVYADDRATSGSFYGWIDYAWDKLLAGWKRKKTVRQQLNRWLRGEGLTEHEESSAVVRNWDVGP